MTDDEWSKLEPLAKIYADTSIASQKAFGRSSSERVAQLRAEAEDDIARANFYSKIRKLYP